MNQVCCVPSLDLFACFPCLILGSRCEGLFWTLSMYSTTLSMAMISMGSDPVSRRGRARASLHSARRLGPPFIELRAPLATCTPSSKYIDSSNSKSVAQKSLPLLKTLDFQHFQNALEAHEIPTIFCYNLMTYLLHAFYFSLQSF